MSTRRGGENIWIAYADMLTVLLMVFLLLAMLFQVIVATSKIAGPENEAGNQKAESLQKTQAQKRNIAGNEGKIGTTTQKLSDNAQAGGEDEMNQVAVSLPLVMVDTAVLQPREGDLRITIQLNRTYLTTIQQHEVQAWAWKNKSVLATAKLRIYSVGRSINVSTGDTLLMQVNRAVATMAVLQKEGAIIKNIRFDNLIVPDNNDDYLILRVEETNADNANKTQ